MEISKLQLSLQPVAYYRFEAGAITADSSANSNTLTLANTPTNGPGKFGNGETFVATSTQYAYAADSASLSITGDLSISMWVKFSSFTGGEMTLFSKYRTDSANRSYVLLWNNSGSNLTLVVSSDGSAATSGSSVWVPATDVWYHVSCVYDASAGAVTFYINGQQLGATQTGLATSIFDGNARGAIAAYTTEGTPTALFDGSIDDVAIFSGTLTAVDILKIYQETLDDVHGFFLA